MYQLSLGSSWGWRPLSHGSNKRRVRTQRQRHQAAAGDAPIQQPSYWQKISAQGLQGPIKAAFTSGSLSALGDLLAQLLAGQQAKSAGKQAPQYDPSRTARMFGFGLAFYGPYQFLWYNMLDHLLPGKSTRNFLCKVAANQLLLAPVVLAVVFAWNLGLQGQGGAAIQSKIQRDLMPSMINGWKFWIPAASINFYAVPLQYQVLYMSCCGVLWTAYLSYASANEVAAQEAAARHAKAAQ